MKGNEIKKEPLRLDSLQPCYLYISASDSILEDKIESIKGFLEEKINLDTDFKVFNGAEETSDEEFYNYISTPSLFSPKKIVVIKYIDKVSSSLQKKIMDLISINNGSSVNMIFILTSAKQKFNTKLIDLVKKTGTVKQLRTPHGGDLKNWLEERSKSDGVVFTDGAASLLIENVDLDLNMLKKEYEKLYDYVSSETKKVIDENAVRSLVSRIYSIKVFDLVDCLGMRDKKGSLEALRSLLEDKQSMIGLVTLIHRMFKCFLYIKSASGRSSVTGYIEDNMKVSPYYISRIVSKYINWSSNYTQTEIIKVFELLNDYDIKFRSGAGQDEHLIGKLISEIADISV